MTYISFGGLVIGTWFYSIIVTF